MTLRFSMPATVTVTVLLALLPSRPALADQVKTANGIVDGTVNADTGVRAFKGIPFAAPPVGERRWKAPQPVANWTGARPAVKFGPRCMQQPIFSDMVFRSDGMSEDCLYLNVWTPAASTTARLPVLVYLFGGGFIAGDGSEPRYDGEAMAHDGIVAVTVNYRLSVFGLLAHPDLTKESPNHSSGNYMLLDQIAALRWVQANIAAFGGDPAKVTIAGESAGSIAVSALMASPLSRALMARAIGESGAMMNPASPPVPLAQAEAQGQQFATSAGATSIAALRAMSAEQLLAAGGGRGTRFSPTIDGWVLPQQPVRIFEEGHQAKVTLLVGSNSMEQSWRSLFGEKTPTPENYRTVLQDLYGARAEEALRLYPGSTSDEVRLSASELASDRFIAHSTWKWFDTHSRTGSQPVYYYFYARPRPARADGTGTPSPGAVHSAEIEYAMGNLSTNTVFVWTPDDHKVSRTMQGYFANFIKTGNPNGPGLAPWPPAKSGDAVQRMRVDADSRVEQDTRRARYLFLDSTYAK